MKKTISFVRTFIPADLFKKEYALGGLTIYHLDEQINAEMNAYECWECSVRSSEHTQDDVMAAFAEFRAKLAASELATAKVQKIAEIDAYDTSSAVNGFYLNGERVWLDFDLRDRVYQGNERLQRIGRTDTTLWLGKQCYNLSIEQAQNIISHIEAYAKDCYNVTAAHKKAVSELASIEEVEKYDITAGYPAQLKMEV
nr:MAG TPA: protein of unknown function (DUF4376) [Caudoviricetes sp.]